MEAKLYRKTRDLERHVMATLGYSATATVKPELVMFAATARLAISNTNFDVRAEYSSL
jgi:hypothetical protein